MSAELASEIWSELKRYINTVDRSEAAETLVSILIDNDSDPDEIRQAFKHDSDIKRALSEYNGVVEEEDEELEEEFDYDEDEDY